MVIDVKKLSKEGKDECDFCFTFDSEKELITLPNTDYVGSQTVTGKLFIEGKTVFIEGEVCYTLAGECSRCLDRAEVTVVSPFNARFVETNPEEDDYLYKSGLVDLSEVVRDQILSSMPYTIHCKEDCKGLCPKCGANLNKTNCNCEK